VVYEAFAMNAHHFPPVSAARRPWVLAAAIAGLCLIFGLSFWVSQAGQQGTAGSAAAVAPLTESQEWLADASAGQAGSAVPGGQAQTGTPGWQSTVTVVLALLAVLGLTYGSLWGLKVLTQHGRLSRSESGLLEVQTSLRLGRDQSLHVVKFGTRMLLVGSATNSLVLLASEPVAQIAGAQPDFEQYLAHGLASESGETGQ
jgi:flagellar biogenesis protein FliO